MAIDVLNSRRARLQAEFFERLVGVIQSEERIASAWLMGSFGRGEEDGWSDFDLHVAIADDAWDVFLAEREALYARLGIPVMVQDEMPSNAVAGGMFQLVQYEHALQVDWNLVPASLAKRPVASRMLLGESPPIDVGIEMSAERRAFGLTRRLAFAWTMAPLVIQYIAREDLVRATLLFDIFLMNGLWPAWPILNHDGPVPVDVNLYNSRIPPELRPQYGAAITQESLVREFRRSLNQASAMHPAALALGATIPDALVETVLSLLRELEDAIG
jgi:predicted nucleotidyltransferase